MKRIIVLFSLLVVTLTATAQVPPAGGLDTGTAKAAPATIRIRCVPSPLPGDQPLFVVDGTPVDTMDMHKIRPEQIESIYILKDDQAKAVYGCRAMAGVVIINLKPRKLYIQAINSYTGERIGAAALRVRIGKQVNEKELPANAVVTVSSFEENMTLEVLATGYNSCRQLISKGTSDTLLVLLEPVAQLLPEVIVKGMQDVRTRTISCGTTGVSICTMYILDNAEKKRITGTGLQSTARLYPNPAASGSQLKIQLSGPAGGKLSLALYGLNGQLVKQVVDKSNAGQINFPLPPAFKGAGILLVQDDAKNIVLKEKVLIQ